MTRITQAMLTSTMLSDLNRIQGKLAKTHEQMSTGKQLNLPSDDPYAVSRALQLQGDLAANQQYQKNIQDGQSWQAVTDTALGNISQYILRARDLLVQGATDSAGQPGRDAIASEIDQLTESVKSEANTQYAGRYVFSGAKTTTAPYTPGGPDTYNGDTTTLKREIGPGIQITLNTIGKNVVGDNTSGLLQSLRQIATDLRAGNSAALQNGDLQSLDTATNTLTNSRAIVGATTNRLDAALSSLQQIEQTTTSLLSNTQDADMAQVMVDASQESAIYQAALHSGATIIQPSLLDFLR